MTTPLSMHSACVPVFDKMLSNLVHWLDAAEAHAVAKKFEVSVLLASRLAPDMLPFTKQVQIGCDMAKFGMARLSGKLSELDRPRVGRLSRQTPRIDNKIVGRQTGPLQECGHTVDIRAPALCHSGERGRANL